MSKSSKDTQSLRFQITINNPLDYGYSHDAIQKIIINNFSTATYFCMADEMGSCYHTHLFICFSSRVRFSMMKKNFPTAHIEKVKGTVTDNINYVKKSGKWANDVKHGTQIEGTYEEFGNRPADSAGKNHDMTVLYQMILDGMTDKEIISHNQDYINIMDKIEKVRTMNYIDEYEGARRLDMEVIYISGETGTGKTRGVLDEYGDKNVFRVTDYKHPFDNYKYQRIIVFDEFRSSLPLSEMLNYLDIYTTELPARYTNRIACFEKVFLISNWALERQYKDLQRDDVESWKAFLRRIKKVRVYTAYQKFVEYESVETYLNRNNHFHLVTDDEKKEIPFNKKAVSS